MAPITIDGLVYESPTQGGIARIFREVLPRLCDLEPDLRLRLLVGQARGPLPQHVQIEQVLLPTLPRLPLPLPGWGHAQRQWREWGVQTAVSSTNPTLWHSSYYTLPPKNGRFPTLQTLYDTIHEQLPHLFASRGDERLRQQKQQALQTADSIVAISATAKQEACKLYGLDPARVWVMPLAASPVFRVLPPEIKDFADSADSSAFVRARPRPIEKDKRPFLLYVGSRIHYKNFAGLLAAYAAWPGRSEVALRVVGRPFSVAEKQQVQVLGVAERVVVETAVSDERLCWLYNHAAAFVYPSLAEGFGIPLLEALACGCPVVASRIPSSLEVAGELATYFEPSEQDSLVGALETAVSQGRQPERVQAGIARAAQFSWEQTAQLLLGIYRELGEGD